MAITETVNQFARGGRAGRHDLQQRVPELAPLNQAIVAVFGLGCIGAPSVLELARAGVNELRLCDPDIVDPGTIVRWPLGFSAVGRAKIEVLSEFIGRNYPYTQVTGQPFRLGTAREGHPNEIPDQQWLEQLLKGVSLIYDATAEFGVQHVLSEWALSAGIPYLCVDGTQGGWGGRVCRILPKVTPGCWMCFQAACSDGTIAAPPAMPNGTVQPPGCGDPIFTGAGFDMAQVAVTAVRIAAATLCGGQAGCYPPYEWDATVLAFRDGNGHLIAPTCHGYRLEKHPKCPRCGREQAA